jgi:hypothetical protein
LSEIYAECLTTGEACLDCQYSQPRRCPLLNDPEYRSFLLYIRDRNRIAYQASLRQHERLLEILRRHKRPLHYQMIARIYSRKYSDLPITDRGVYSMLSQDEDVVAEGDGVYRVR